MGLCYPTAWVGGDVLAPFPLLLRAPDPGRGEGSLSCWKQEVPRAEQAGAGGSGQGRWSQGLIQALLQLLSPEVPFPRCFLEVSNSVFPFHLHKSAVSMRNSPEHPQGQ